MNISVKYSTIAKMLKNKEDKLYLERENIFGYHIIRTVETGSYNDDYTANINLVDFGADKLKKMHEVFSKYDVSQKTLTTIKNWIDNIENPKNAVVTSLQSLLKLLTNIFNGQKLKWVWKENPDGVLVPYYVNEVKYKARTQDDDAYVVVSISATSYDSTYHRLFDSDERLNLKSEKRAIYFYNGDIKDITEEEFQNLFESNDNDNDDDEDGEENEPKKKKKKEVVKGNNFLSQILVSKGLYLNTDKLYEDYKKHLADYAAITKKIGKVFVADGKGLVIEDNTKNASLSWRNINVDDKISKLVVDISGEKQTSLTSPLHPYVLTYNLSQYSYCCVHVSNIKEYEFDSSIIDKLVMDEKKKKLLSALVETGNNFSDIVAGKSGGIIILGSGDAGLGKTLTAEMYSELMGKPLYSIQSAQLGINIEDIEKRLNKILYRAEKWNAVLLIDEADAYVYKRGNDIHQNCIVGTFLRLLEYFNGVMFLTTNRADIIDEAIMSRVTAHIKYEYPTDEQSKQLWNVLSSNFGLTIDDKNISKILQTYEKMSGRDIRNTMKMIVKTNSSKKITLDLIQELEEFLPFIKRKK